MYSILGECLLFDLVRDPNLGLSQVYDWWLFVTKICTNLPKGITLSAGYLSLTLHSVSIFLTYQTMSRDALFFELAAATQSA